MWYFGLKTLKIVHSCNIFNGNAIYRQTDAKFKSPLETRQQMIACASGQLHEKPPVFCKHAARTIIWIKNEDAIKKFENLGDTYPC